MENCLDLEYGKLFRPVKDLATTTPAKRTNTPSRKRFPQTIEALTSAFTSFDKMVFGGRLKDGAYQCANGRSVFDV